MAVNQVKVVISGVTHILTYNGTSGLYEATINAPSTTSFNLGGGVFPITVEATDVAGNVGTGASSIKVLETTKPVITILNPTSGARLITSSPTINGSILDEVGGSGIKQSDFVLKVDGVVVPNASITFTPVSRGYDFSYVKPGLSDGTHNITVDGKDNDGNIAVQKSVSFDVDTVAPSLSVSSPTEGLITNVKNVTVNGTTSDVHSNPVVVTIKVNGVDAGVVTINGSTFSKAITLTEGSNSIVVRATDGLGLFTEVTRTVVVDSVKPVIGTVTVSPNPVNVGGTFTIKVSVTD